MYLSYTTCAVLLLFVAWIAYESGRKAEQEPATSLFNLGMAYMLGEGDCGEDDERSIGRAIDYLREAAERGHARAAYILGQLYYGDLFHEAKVERDYAEAYNWFDCAAANELVRHEFGRLRWREKRALRKYLAETKQEFERKQADSKPESDPEWGA
jgi:TPR repeat protein